MQAGHILKPHVIAVDIGGTSMRLGIVSPDGSLMDVVRLKTPAAGRYTLEEIPGLQAQLFDLVAEQITSLRQRHPEINLNFAGISFGAVITNDGIVRNASILWHHPASGFDVVAALRSRLNNLSVIAINDVSAAAWRYRDEKRFALITVSTGVGGKVFNDQLSTLCKLELDDAGLGGEMGHVIVNPQIVTAAVRQARALAASRVEDYTKSSLAERTCGEISRITAVDLGQAAVQGDNFAIELIEAVGLPYCECGNLADLCSYTSGPAVERMARSLARNNPDAFARSRLAEIVRRRADEINSFAIASAAKYDDAFTAEILERATYYLSLKILQLCADLGLDKVLITGGFANGVGAPYFEALHENLKRQVSNSGYFTGWGEEELRQLVKPCPDYADDGLIGVGLLVQERACIYLAAQKLVGQAKLELQDRRRQSCGPQQVTARILYAGICSTDLQIYRGERGLEPGVLGHECVAEAVEVGAGVGGLTVGDVLAINPNNPLDDDDKIGHTREGFFQEYFTFNRDLISKRQVIALPRESRPEWVLLELLACVLHSQDKISDSYAGRDVLIVGSGITGLLHAMVARHRGARRVLMTNRSERKLEFAVASGLIRASDAIKLSESLADDVLAATGGKGADVIIIALAGDAGAAMTECVIPCTANSAKICLFGGFLKNTTITIGAEQVIDCGRIRNESLEVQVETKEGKTLALVGSRGSRHADYERARDLVLRSELDIRKLVTHVIPISSLPAVIDELSRSGTAFGEFAMRVVVAMTQPV